MGIHYSRIALGMWRLLKSNITTKQLSELIFNSIDMGITTFDNADIYGAYQCEEIFGNVIKGNNSLRKKMQIVTKCGIKLVSPKFPETTIKHYDTSKTHIIKSVDNSLSNMKTDYVDLLLIHRPDPLINADECAEAIYELKKSGKVLEFGVSNFLPHHFSLLQSRLDFQLVTNQIEVSVMKTDHFDNGNIDFLQEKRIKPMVWSPLAGGKIFNDENEKALRVRNTLSEIAKKYSVNIDAIASAWLLVHPVNFILVLGSVKLDRIKSAMEGLNIKLSREEWFKILAASKGCDVP